MLRTSTIAAPFSAVGKLLGFAISGLLCGACAADPGGAEALESTPPELSEEDQTSVQRTIVTKVFEIALSDGKIEFFEPSPGEFLALHSFPMGTDVSNLPLHLPPLELYRALAPDAPIPQPVLDAQERSERADAHPEPEELGLGEPGHGLLAPDPAPQPSFGAVATTSQALTSTIPLSWFMQQYCIGYAGPIKFEHCSPFIGTGGFSWASAHQHGSAVCGDTGQATWRIKVSGKTLYVVDVPYGGCLRWGYHGPHDWLGQSLNRTIENRIDWALQTVHFAGYFVDGHPFHNVPPGY